MTDPLTLDVDPPDGHDTVHVMAGYPDRIDTLKADGRGRVCLGTDYADRRVRVAVVEVLDGDE